MKLFEKKKTFILFDMQNSMFGIPVYYFKTFLKNR